MLHSYNHTNSNNTSGSSYDYHPTTLLSWSETYATSFGFIKIYKIYLYKCISLFSKFCFHVLKIYY